MTDATLDSFLANLPRFDSLSDRDRQALSLALERRSLAAGDKVITQDQRGDGAYFLISGELRVEIEVDGATKEVGVVTPGELFGVLAMVDHRPRSASCVAKEASEIAFLSRPAFEMLAHRHAGIGYPFQRAVAAQVASDFREAVARIRGHLS